MMSNPVEENTKSLDGYFKEISKLEKRIASEISPVALDYLYILLPNSKKEINFNSPLTGSQTKLLQEYNAIALKIIEGAQIPIEIKGDDVFKKFVDLSHEVYLLRYIEARKYFIEYCLARVLSEPEAVFLNRTSPDSEQQASVEIIIPEAFVMTPSGVLDFEKSLEHEEQTNLIASTFSSYSNLLDLSSRMYRDLYNISNRTFLVSMNRDALVSLFQDILHVVIIEINKEVYKYINSGYRSEEAKDNVISMLQKTTPVKGYPERLLGISNDIEEILEDGLKAISLKDEKILVELKGDIKQLLLLYIKEGLIVSSNFYNIEFVHHDDLPEIISHYTHIINSYLYDDFGNTLNEPSETYEIRYSTNFKKILFNLVTNGNINPNLTLAKYLQL